MTASRTSMGVSSHLSGKLSHPLWLRLSHWGFALAIVILIPSGWQIYNASPVFPFHFPAQITLGGWLAGGIQWHFAAIWLLWVSTLAYLAGGLVSGRFRRKYFPVSWRGFWRDLWLAATLQLPHDDLEQYNMVQKVSYLVAILAMLATIASGLVIWKSVQFHWLSAIVGNYDTARIVHFAGMTILCGFLMMHVSLVVLVPRTLLGMIAGRLYFGGKR